MKAGSRRMPCNAPPVRQKGVMTVAVAILLVVGVVFILGQALGIIGTRSADNAQQLDSTAALAIAESGLQRSEAILGSSATTVSDSICTGITGTYTLGRGSFTYGTSVAAPPSCGVTGGTPCETCEVNVTGTVGSASRTLNQQYKIGVAYGTAGRGQTVTMVLKNTYDVPAVSLFNLAWKRHDGGGGGNADATYCTDGGAGCGLQWHVESSSGSNTVGGMGVSVAIAANTLSRLVVQNLSASRDYVEVGGLFPSVSTTSTPTIVGSYWDDKQSDHDRRTKGNASEIAGAVIGGVVPGVSTCIPAPSVYPSGPGTAQSDTCTAWCRDADTMVFGFSARSEAITDLLNSVTFGSGPNVAMTQLVHFPNLDGTTPNASGTTYSEIWYAYNPAYNYLPGTTLGATSYPTVFNGTVGARVNAVDNIGNTANSLTVPSPASSHFSDANSKICIGDILSLASSGNDRFQSATAINSTPDGLTCSRAAGVYGFNKLTTGTMNSNPDISFTSSVVQVQTSNLIGTVAVDSPITAVSSGTAFMPSAGPVANSFALSASTYLPSTTLFRQGNSGTTVTVPSGTVAPTAGTILSVYSGTGQFMAQTRVMANPAPTSTSFTVSTAPATGLVGASICGGTCAFFDSPTDVDGRTPFTITRGGPGTTQYWGGGFMCLSGVDGSKIIKLEATTLKTGRWQETVQ